MESGSGKTTGAEPAEDSGKKRSIGPRRSQRRRVCEDLATSIAIWSEDIVLDPGNVRYPIRVVLVDNLLETRFDRLVKLPEGCSTYIYRVLDHGIPWQHLEAGLTLEEVKKEVLNLCKGKRLVMYDAWRQIGLFGFTEQQLSRLKMCDLKSSSKTKGPNKQPLLYWDLVREKLGHVYNGKPGDYDTIELTDFVMNIYLKYLQEDEDELANLNAETAPETTITSLSS